MIHMMKSGEARDHPTPGELFLKETGDGITPIIPTIAGERSS